MVVSTPPMLPPRAVAASALTGAEPLRQRHRNNPAGDWKPMGDQLDWLGKNYIVAALVEGEWVRVSFHEARGRTAGVVETKPRKKRASVEKTADVN
jgi:hypothetical protein